MHVYVCVCVRACSCTYGEKGCVGVGGVVGVEVQSLIKYVDEVFR